MNDHLTGEQRLIDAILGQSWRDLMNYHSSKKNGRKLDDGVRNSVMTDLGQAKTLNFWSVRLSRLYLKRHKKLEETSLEDLKKLSGKFKKQEKKNAE